MFDCMLDKCPKDPEKCHLWWEIPWENQETGEVEFRRGCILSQEMGLPIVQSIVRAAHTASEHSSVARNSFENGVNVLQETINNAIEYADNNKMIRNITDQKVE